MKHLNLYIFWCVTAVWCFKDTRSTAQGPITRAFFANTDSLRAVYEKSKEDTTRLLALAYLCNEVARYEPDSAIQLAQEGLKLAKQIHFARGEALLKTSLGVAFSNVGDYANAIKWLSSNLAYAETTTDLNIKLGTYAELGIVYRDHGDYDEALKYSEKCIYLIEKYYPRESCSRCRGIFLFPAIIYLEKNELDSAKKYLDRAFSYPLTPGGAVNATVYDVAGRVHTELMNYDSALQFYRKGINAFRQLKHQVKGLARVYNSMASLMNTIGSRDSAVFYLHKSLSLSRQRNFRKEILDANLLLANVYDGHDVDSSLYYYKQSMQTKDILYDREKQRQIASYKFDLELQELQAENTQVQFRNQIKIYALIGVALFLSAIGVILWRNSDRRKKDLILIKEQKAEADRQREKAEQSIKELKATQAQLIQSEKMASLGELTAGIAHEIQNPLNFVNNFSEVNAELLTELNQQIENGNFEEVKEIAKNVIDNQQKINQHGKRADGIVKSMLQHSRSSSGQTELTDVNALCDECLRLIYHGFRAKDKSFNAKLNSHFDPSLPKVNVVPQDIGRVLLNLISNAFYAVNEKAKINTTEYVPTVTVATKLSNGKIEICVQDNGDGVPSAIKEKIFQPFFTTKPTGQGTGLGLSLSYDIVIAHGGEILMNTEEGIGSEFIIRL